MRDERSLEALREASRQKLEAMAASLRELGSVLVAFSGGVDSALVLKVAVEALQDRAVALTAVSASVAPGELDEAQALARSLGARHLCIPSNELQDPQYAANPTNRCYFCKSELYALCARTREELGLGAIVDGFNADDTRDHRPGHVAAKEHGVRSPLAEAGLTKAEIRAWSQHYGLPTWDKPPTPCLASRIPYGTPVTRDTLLQIGSAEAELKTLGLRTFRLRYHGPVARLEVAADEYPRFSEAAFREQVNAALQRRGFSFVALDLEPFRSGRLNEAAGLRPQ